jgi:hypothetical protein
VSSYDEYERYLAVYEGDLFVFLDDEQENDDREHPAGQVRLFVLNADAAESEGESLFDVLDERAETAAYIHLLEDDAGNFSREVCKILGEEVVFCRNILILDRLEILPRFRGQQLGLKYVWPHWVALFDLQWKVIESQRLEPDADLPAVMSVVVDRLTSEGWEIEAPPRFGFLYPP